jgi:hypothetical protein
MSRKTVREENLEIPDRLYKGTTPLSFALLAMWRPRAKFMGIQGFGECRYA